jgi:enoyl-CoA hydratase
MSDVIAPVVSLERDRVVARVIIGTGLRRNALSTGAWAGLARSMQLLAGEDTVRAVIVEGAAGWFCAGSDISEWVDATPEQIELSFTLMEAACTAIEDLPVPVIAKVRGAAAGAGCQLALACDLRVLSHTASIGMPIAVLGIRVSPVFANRLAVHGGAAVARDLLYTGRMVGADEAVRLGLANDTVPGDELDRRVEAVVESILGASDASIRAAKHALGLLATPARLAARAAAAGQAVDDEDFRRGVNAFVDRRRRRTIRVLPT